MAKFTFPLPHRRQKAEPPPPLTISAPLSKVQKLLGSEDLARDSILSEDQSKHWETHSNSGVSGISISVSESSTSHVGSYNTGFLGLGDGKDLRPPRNRVPRGAAWEQESEIIPRTLKPSHGGLPRCPGETAIDPLDVTSDASSLRRQQSSSTIVSFYDKSKVPLSISQQTSNSAMAKGLPSKASALLDMEGGGGAPQMPQTKERKKPAKLDLAHLLPKSRFGSHLSSPSNGLVLGTDALTKSPSILSLSPGPFSGPHSPAPTDKKLRKKLTKESLRSLRTQKSNSHLEPPVAPSSQRRATNETAGLHSLYEHYENITLKEATDDAEEVAGALGTSKGQPATSDDALSPGSVRGHATSGSSQAASSSKGSSQGASSRTGTPLTTCLSPPSLTSAATTDCAASISSRHTRTSKASRKTDQSFSDFDPRVNSVLSLSSDSEDESSRPPKTAVSVPEGNRRSAASLAPSEPLRPRTSRSANSQTAQTPGSSHSKSSTGSSPVLGRQYLGIPARGLPISKATPPVVTARTSSLATTGTHSTHSALSSKTTSPSSRASSRLSSRSNSTANSVATNLKPPRPQSHQILGQEIRPMAMVAAFQTSHSAQQHPHNTSLHRSGSHGSSRASLTEPPISPTSVEFYLRSQHGSILEFDSLPPGGVPNATAAASQQAGSDGRFMAVTKQEEMLLAALRMKRAHMRESSPSESDDHEEPRSDSRMSALSEQPQKPSARSSSSTATLRDITPRGSSRTGSGPPASSHSDPTQARPTAGLSAAPRRSQSKQEQILLYLDQPVHGVHGVHGVHALDAAEPSPGLNDFMDFDEDSNGSDEFPMPPTTVRPSAVSGRETPSSAEKIRLTSRAYLSPFPKPAGGGKRSSAAATPSKVRSGSRSISPQCFPRGVARRDEDSPVRILETPVEGLDDGEESEVDMPRPDSPIGAGGATGFLPEEVQAPLPRKKAVRISAVGQFSNILDMGW